MFFYDSQCVQLLGVTDYPVVNIAVCINVSKRKNAFRGNLGLVRITNLKQTAQWLPIIGRFLVCYIKKLVHRDVSIKIRSEASTDVLEKL